MGRNSKFSFDTKKLIKEVKKEATKQFNKQLFDIECPHCKAKVQISSGLSKCPKCGEKIDLSIDVKF